MIIHYHDVDLSGIKRQKTNVRESMFVVALFRTFRLFIHVALDICFLFTKTIHSQAQ